MNTGIITSFIVSGILLLAILAMNMNISRSSSELTMRQISQQHTNTAAELLNYDFPKIGYDEYAIINNPISVAQSNRIKFESNLNNSGSTEIVEWKFDNSGATPSDYKLYRIVDGDLTKLNGRIPKFTIRYYDKDKLELSTPISGSTLDNIRYIKVNFTISSKEKLGKVGGSGEYIFSPWQKTYAPKNLSN